MVSLFHFGDVHQHTPPRCAFCGGSRQVADPLEPELTELRSCPACVPEAPPALACIEDAALWRRLNQLASECCRQMEEAKSFVEMDQLRQRANVYTTAANQVAEGWR